MRIAILGPYFYPQIYGIEKVMYAHAKHLASRGHEVHVLTSRLRFPQGEFENITSKEVMDGFTIHRVKVLVRSLPKQFSYPSKGGLIISGITRTLANIKPNIVHVHNIGAPAWAFIGARYAKKNSVPFFYSPYFHPGRLKLNYIRKFGLRALNGPALRYASRVFHQTHRDVDLFKEDYSYVTDSQTAILRNGINPPKVDPVKKSSAGLIVILFVGRVDDERKGFSILADAYATLDSNVRKQIFLRIVGTISSRYKEYLIQRFGTDIQITGDVSEECLELYYAEADIFVMPSFYEGFGMPFIEAMRYDVAVIGTDVGGIPEVVVEGAGLLVPPGDVRALATAIGYLVNNPMEREKIAKAGKQWAKGFYWDMIVDELESDYKNHCRLASK